MLNLIHNLGFVQAQIVKLLYEVTNLNLKDLFARIVNQYFVLSKYI